jgi:hypothetical protein
MSEKLNIDELAAKYADKFLYLQRIRQNEGWGDTIETKKVILASLIKKAFEELE